MDSIHSGHRERLREQYARNGIDGFQEHQILELLLTYAIPRKDTNALAHRLLEQFGSLEQIFHAEISQLMQVEGIGQSAAIFLRMQSDVTKHMQLRRLEDRSGKIRLTSPFASAKYAAAMLSQESYESVYAICLNKAGAVLHAKNVTSGNLVEAPIYPRLIVEYALLQRAHSIILMHNHPSGNPTPSKEDCDATALVRAALQSVEIPLVDHLIVGGQYVYSFSVDLVMLLQPGATQPISMSLDEFAARLQQETSVVGESYGRRAALRFVREGDQ